MEIGLNRTEQEIEKYEKKYQVNSKVFLKDFTADDLNEGDNEYIKWSGEIKLKKRILLRKKKELGWREERLCSGYSPF